MLMMNKNVKVKKRRLITIKSTFNNKENPFLVIHQLSTHLKKFLIIKMLFVQKMAQMSKFKEISIKALFQFINKKIIHI